MLPKGFKHSEETKKSISKSHTGLKFEEQHKKNHAEAVRKFTSTKEYREKMSAVKKGIPMPIDSLTGAGINNKCAKTWWFIKNKKHYKFKNLALFIRENQDLFDSEDLVPYKSRKDKCLAYCMLKGLFVVRKDGRLAIPSQEWKGWMPGDKEIPI